MAIETAHLFDHTTSFAFRLSFRSYFDLFPFHEHYFFNTYHISGLQHISAFCCGLRLDGFLCGGLARALAVVSRPGYFLAEHIDGRKVGFRGSLLDGTRFPGFFTRDGLACCSPACRWTFLAGSLKRMDCKIQWLIHG